MKNENGSVMVESVWGVFLMLLCVLFLMQILMSGWKSREQEADRFWQKRQELRKGILTLESSDLDSPTRHFTLGHLYFRAKIAG